MKITFLRDSYVKLVRGLRFDLGLYRLLTAALAIALPAFKVLLPVEVRDPFWIRCALAGLFASIFIASYAFAFVRKHIVHFGHFVIYAVTAWAAWLVVENAYSNSLLIHFLFVLLFAGANFKRFRACGIFVVLVLMAGLVACILPNRDQVDLWPYLGLLVLTLASVLLASGLMIVISEERLRQRNIMNSIFESSPDAILIANAQTLEIRASNRNAARMFSVGGLRSQSILHTKLSIWLAEYLAEKQGTARIGRGISKVETLNSQMLWVEVVITELSADYRPEYLVAISDVTEKHAIADRLQFSDDILQQVDHIVLVADHNANIIYATPSVKKILGYDVQDVLGQGWWNLRRKNGEDPQATITYIKAFASGEAEARPSNYEVRHITRSGKEEWILWKDNRTADGLVMGVGMPHTQARREAAVRSVIFNIAEASSHAKNPGEFYHYIHQEIRHLIDTPNFYIAVYDADNDEVSFPYYKDAEDSNYLARAGRKRKSGHGLTEYGIKRRMPVLLSKDDIEELGNRGIVNVKGQAIPEVWLGVPLMHEDKVVGLITFQDYERPNAYSQDDLTLVNFVASQVAQFVAKLQADEALRLSEERFRSIYKQAAVGIAQLTPEGTILQVNDKMADIFGYSVEELLTMIPQDFTHPDDIDLGREELIEVMEGKRASYSKEKRYIHKMGHVVYALLNVSAYMEHGEPVFVISVYEDITDKKQAQNETELLLRLNAGLNEAQDMDAAVEMTLKELVDFDDWGYGEGCWLDATGLYRPCTRQFVMDPGFQALADRKRIIPDGLYTAELSGKIIGIDDPDARFFPEITAPAIALGATGSVLLPIVHNQKVIVMLWLMSRKTSGYRPSLEKLADAVSAQLLAVHLRKMAEAARIESENRYRSITQAAFEGIAIYQGNRILDCNAAFARLFAYEIEEILETSLDKLLYNDSPRQLLGELGQGDRSSAELTGRKKQGEPIHLEALSRQDQWQGQPARILAVRDITSQKMMEEARESARLDARFKAYIQNSAEIIKIIDSDGRIQYCSPSYSRLFGVAADTVIGRNNTDLIVPEDRAVYLFALEEVRRHPKESPQIQLRFMVDDGSIRFLQTKLTNLIDDPMIKGILISEGDITHVIEAQQSRQESEQRFKLLFERSPDAIFVESENGYILDVNEAACRLHEMSREELIGCYVPDLVPAESRDAVIANFHELMEGKVSYLQGESITKTGRAVEVEIRCNVIHFQNQPALLLLVRDISQRKKEQLMLKESEERFRALVEHATEAIFVIDVDADRLIEANKNAQVLFGFSREVLLAIPSHELSAQYQADGSESLQLQPLLYDRALEGEVVVYEWLIQNHLQEDIPCEIRLVKFPSATQRLVRASVTDITDRKQAELKMLQSREVLRLQNERLIELASSNALNSGDLDLAFEEITMAMSDLLHVTLAGVWLFDATSERLVCRKEFNAETRKFQSGRQVAVAEFPKYFALMAKQRVLAESDARQAASVTEFLENSILPKDIYSILDAPFRHGGRIAGMLWTMQLHAPHQWEPEELNLAASMADMVTLALQSWERKKAEEELASTLTKMQATFESTRDGILLLDSDGYLLDYNEGYLKLSQIPKSELDSGVQHPGLETMIAQILEPDHYREARARIAAHPDAEERYVYQTQSGQVIEMYARQMLVEGKPSGVLWFLHDITDLKRIEQALLENETKFRNLFSQANDAIILLDQSTFIECNNKAEEMWGLSRQELLGKRSDDLSPEFQPDGRSSKEKSIENNRAAYQGESLRFYWQHTKGDGQPFDAEVSLNRIQIGEKFFIQALVRDITERLKTENALLESERNNKALLDGIPDLILRITEDGLILDCKQSDQQSQMRIAEGAIGKRIMEVLPSELANKVLAEALLSLDQGRNLQFESELKWNGLVLDTETRIVRSGSAEVLAIIRDVTERKRTEKELIKRNFELDSFVYRASHDLKAPLNSLMGLIGLVEGETQDQVVLQYVKMMNKSVVKLDTFIRDLADFSRNERLELAQNSIDWQALLDEILENLQFADGADRIQKVITIDVPQQFYSDPVRIGIVLSNLVSNAIKYQNLKRSDSRVEISMVRKGDFVELKVADNGIGIAKEHQAKVFNLFFRASIQSYGSGMGMYIVKHAIDRIKGVILLQSVEGEGTTFTVTIPDLGPPKPEEEQNQ